MRNQKISDYADKRKQTGGGGSAETHTKQLTGVSMDSGAGTRATNDMFQSSVSHHGVKEAFNPSGPSGK